MKKIVVNKDLGEKETFDKWNGKFLDETSYDTVHHVTEDTGIMKPIQSLDGSDVPLAYVITNAYGDDSVRNTLMTSLAVHLHPEEDRVFTTKEAARIMTLPEDYKYTGTLNQNLARIGLMVAPLCMKYLADNIYENILKPYGEVK